MLSLRDTILLAEAARGQDPLEWTPEERSAVLRAEKAEAEYAAILRAKEEREQAREQPQGASRPVLSYRHAKELRDLMEGAGVGHSPTQALLLLCGWMRGPEGWALCEALEVPIPTDSRACAAILQRTPGMVRTAWYRGRARLELYRPQVHDIMLKAASALTSCMTARGKHPPGSNWDSERNPDPEVQALAERWTAFVLGE